MQKQPEAQSIVFVVDDDASLREALKSLLRSVGLRVEVFGSAADFLKHKFLDDAAACLVLDIRLPGLSGLDFQAELAKAGIQIPIIFISGHGDIPMTVRAMKAGAVEFLTKPFREQDLLDAVQVALDRDRKRRTEDKAVREIRARFEALTPREQQVISLVASGNDEQADRGRARCERNHRKSASRQRHEEDGRALVGRPRTNGRHSGDPAHADVTTLSGPSLPIRPFQPIQIRADLNPAGLNLGIVSLNSSDREAFPTFSRSFASAPYTNLFKAGKDRSKGRKRSQSPACKTRPLAGALQMNYSILTADRNTHLKIITLALIGALTVAVIGWNARIENREARLPARRPVDRSSRRARRSSLLLAIMRKFAEILAGSLW